MISSSQLQIVVGKIIKRALGKGSQASKMVNAVLTDQGMDIIIRHETGTAFQDEEFDALEGKRVQLTGTMQSYVLVVEVAEELAASAGDGAEKTAVAQEKVVAISQ